MRPRNRVHSNRSVAIAAGVGGGAIILVAVLAAMLLPGSGGRPASAAVTPQVTLFITPIPPATDAPPPSPTPVPPTPTPEPTPEPQVTQYTVVEGDTLWDIAVKYGLSFDALLAVNPNINPDLVRPGDVVNLPGPNVVIPTRAPAVVSGTGARVGLDGSGLRLRAGPSTNDEVITKLAPGTELTVLQRTADNQWLQVTTPQGTRGWVMRMYVELTLDLAQVPVAAGAVAESPASAGSSGSAAAQPSVPQVAASDDPNFSGLGRAAQIYAQGQAMGNHANVFSIIGDSNTANMAYLAAFDWGNYDLGPYGYLQTTIDFFRGSFSRARIAARGGFNTAKALDPGLAPGGCGGDSSLGCEIRTNRPSVAFILLGTGDQHTWDGFESRYRQIIEFLLSQGVIPVLMTKGDDLEATDSSAPYDYINGVIRRLSGEYAVPMLNARQALAGLPNRGLDADNFHINQPADNKSGYFTSGYLSYGYNMLNLTTLRALDALRRHVLQ
jgi:LysM repeat protein